MRLAEARKFMITFNEALGVACRDCHDLRDFASDEKPLKLAARDMMKMQRELSETWFAGRGEVVTCWTCHRGELTPPTESGFASLLADSAEAGTGEPAAGDR
jgi:photosynthetic reaction center cytochrome c subunit